MDSPVKIISLVWEMVAGFSFFEVEVAMKKVREGKHEPKPEESKQPAQPSDEPSWTAPQVAVVLNVKLWRVHELVRAQILPVFYLGRQQRFRPEAIRKYMATGGKRLDGGWRKQPANSPAPQSQPRTA